MQAGAELGEQSTSERGYASLESSNGVNMRSKISNTCTYLFVRVGGNVLLVLGGLHLFRFLSRRVLDFLDTLDLALARSTTWRVLARRLWRRLTGVGWRQYEVRVVVRKILPGCCEHRVKVALKDAALGRWVFALARALWGLSVWVIILVVEQFVESLMSNKRNMQQGEICYVTLTLALCVRGELGLREHIYIADCVDSRSLIDLSVFAVCEVLLCTSSPT